MGSYRFRVGEQGELVLQVYEVGAHSGYQWERKPAWRDATVADIPVADPFAVQRESPPLVGHWPMSE